MREKNTGAYIKAVTDEAVTVAGYGVLFGGADLEGESFSPATDFMLDLAPVKLVLYDHGLRSVNHVIGKTISVEPDEQGLWVEAELDRNKAYVDMVVQLVEKGALGWSSGSVGHLTRRSGKSITQWPIVELSLTPTPAEPRTLGVELIKSLSATDPSFAVFLPETASAAVVVETKAKDVDAPEPEFIQEENEMANEHEIDDDDEAVDVTALVNSAVTKAFAPMQTWLDQQPVKTAEIAVPGQLKLGRGDTEIKAYGHYLRTGDEGGIRHMKASNATDMNIGTPADGGYAVPTGHYQNIIARMSEAALYGPLGVLNIPGKGTTVNVPIDAEADGEFVSTGEASATDLDAPAVGQAPMTLVKYTKRLEISWELLNDEDSQLMPFIENFVGRGMAKTHNQLLVTEASTNGTLGGATGNPLVAANIPALVGALPTGYEDGAAWVMRKATEYVIRGLTGTNFQFVTTPPDAGGSRRELFGYPLYNSSKVAAAAASAKSILFGNFRYMGMRLAPDITFIRDPYSKAGTGQLVLHYYFRTVYKVLQAEAILFGTQGT
jgi:HK97 family phage major capsid protein